MTLQGYTDLETELKRLKSTERPDVIKAIAAAREHGDLSENAEYHAARERQAFIEGRVGIIEDLLSRAEVIDVSAIKGKIIKFGATVKVEDEDTDEKSAYQIVGEHEADIKSGKLSVTSPMARADRQNRGRSRRGHAGWRQVLRNHGRAIQIAGTPPQQLITNESGK